MCSRRPLNTANMPSKKRYDLVNDDTYDSRIPLHNEEAFQHGITFKAKYIGTLDVPRPSSRVEIVAAMRRIRFEFKAKAIRKKKVNITISTEGSNIVLRKKKKKKNAWYWNEDRLLLMSHPIYRIFYVSHDSQDLKIFSYIARDGSTNVFRCHVFKAYKKNVAMRIVRTIGQAFEVCHKIVVQKPAKDVADEDETVRVDKEAPVGRSDSEDEDEEINTNLQQMADDSQHYMNALEVGDVTPGTIASPVNSPMNSGELCPLTSDTPLSSYHQAQLLRQQLDQQEQQTQVAIAQVRLLKDQLQSEATARIEAQARTHQLLLQNRDLLDHISQLVTGMQQLETEVSMSRPPNAVAFPTNPSPPQALPLPDTMTPKPSMVDFPVFHGLDSNYLAEIPERGLFENANFKADPLVSSVSADSPDSGHREMSSDSLSYNYGNMENGSWCKRDRKLPMHSNPFGSGGGSSVTNGPVHPPIIMPCPMQDASGNRLDLGLPPRIDPPPSVPRNASRSSGVGADKQPDSTPQKEPSWGWGHETPQSSEQHPLATVSSHIPSRSYGTAVTTERLPPAGGPVEVDASESSSVDSTAHDYSANDLDLTYELESDPITKETKELNNANQTTFYTVMEDTDFSIADLTHSPGANYENDDDTKLHISLSDEENNDNISDDSGIPTHKQEVTSSG